MRGERFNNQDMGTFFGNIIYKRSYQNHGIRELDALVSWDSFTKKYVSFAGQGSEGATPLRSSADFADPVGQLSVQFVESPMRKEDKQPAKCFMG